MQIKRKNMYSLLVVLFLCLGIGYAALSTNLSINGTAHVDNATWNIYWDNVQVTTGSVTAQTPTISNQTTVSYEITLHQPGDFYEFTVDVVNSGTIDGMISSITSKLNNVVITTLPSYLDYSITYYDDKPILLNHLLAAGNTETLKVRISYKTDIDPDDLPDTDQQLNLNFTITYTQADENAIPVDHTRTVYFAYTESTISLNQPFPSSITTYETAQSLIATVGSSKPYFKFILQNDTIKEAWVGIYIPNNYSAQLYNVNPGYYYLRGGVNEYYGSGAIRNANYALLQTMGSGVSCSSSGYDYNCSSVLVNGSANLYGNVYFQSGQRWRCTINGLSVDAKCYDAN